MPAWINDFWADMMIVDGPVLGPFATRDEALDAEHRWLLDHGLPCATFLQQQQYYRYESKPWCEC